MHVVVDERANTSVSHTCIVWRIILSLIWWNNWPASITSLFYYLVKRRIASKKSKTLSISQVFGLLFIYILSWIIFFMIFTFICILNFLRMCLLWFSIGDSLVMFLWSVSEWNSDTLRPTHQSMVCIPIFWADVACQRVNEPSIEQLWQKIVLRTYNPVHCA